jgi:anti-anti-sigma regulatory factor
MRKSLGSSVKGIQLINAKPDVRRILDISRFDKMFVIA